MFTIIVTLPGFETFIYISFIIIIIVRIKKQQM